jgi:hypothetical protein
MDGQEHVWIAIHDSKPRVGLAPPRPDKRTGKMLPSGILEGHDWSISSDYWDSSRPYRACIPVDLEVHEQFPEGRWVSAPFTMGRDWGDSDSSGWRITPTVRKFIFSTRQRVRPIVSTIMSIYSDKQGYTSPPYLSLNWLENSFLSEEALAAQIADARRHMLDQYGFIIFNLLQNPDLRMRPAMAPLVGEITDIGLVGRRHRGVIVKFDLIEPSHLHALLMRYIPIHYQWFPTSTGPFDPKALRAYGHDMATHLKSQTTLAFAPRKGKEREASPKHPAGPVQKKPAKYIAVQKVGEEDKGRRISKNEYKRLMEWYRGVHKSLPGGDIFYAYENNAENEDNAMSAGPVVTAKDMAAHEARMAALPREEPSTCPDNVIVPAVATAESDPEASLAVVMQGVMTAEPEASLVAVMQGVTTQGAVNEEPAQVTVTAPIAEAIEVSVASVPDSGTEPHEEGEASFTPGSPIAPWIPQDISTTPPSPRANSRPSSPPDARVVLPASMNGFMVCFISLLLNFHSHQFKAQITKAFFTPVHDTALIFLCFRGSSLQASRCIDGTFNKIFIVGFQADTSCGRSGEEPATSL